MAELGVEELFDVFSSTLQLFRIRSCCTLGGCSRAEAPIHQRSLTALLKSGLEETQTGYHIAKEKWRIARWYLREKRRRDERSGERERWRGKREFGSGGGEAEETRTGDLSSKRGSHGCGGGVECERQALCHMKRFGVLIKIRSKSEIQRRLILPRRRENITRGFLRSVLFSRPYVFTKGQKFLM